MINAIRCFFACTALAAISAIAPSTAFAQVPVFGCGPKQRTGGL
jgi:hypothetical protein